MKHKAPTRQRGGYQTHILLSTFVKRHINTPTMTRRMKTRKAFSMALRRDKADHYHKRLLDIISRKKKLKNAEWEPEESSKQKNSFVMQQKHLNTNYSPLITTRQRDEELFWEIISVFLPRHQYFSLLHKANNLLLLLFHVLLKVSTAKSACSNTFYLSHADRKLETRDSRFKGW